MFAYVQRSGAFRSSPIKSSGKTRGYNPALKLCQTIEEYNDMLYEEEQAACRGLNCVVKEIIDAFEVIGEVMFPNPNEDNNVPRKNKPNAPITMYIEERMLSERRRSNRKFEGRRPEPFQRVETMSPKEGKVPRKQIPSNRKLQLEKVKSSKRLSHTQTRNESIPRRAVDVEESRLESRSEDECVPSERCKNNYKRRRRSRSKNRARRYDLDQGRHRPQAGEKRSPFYSQPRTQNIDGIETHAVRVEEFLESRNDAELTIPDRYGSNDRRRQKIKSRELADLIETSPNRNIPAYVRVTSSKKTCDANGPIPRTCHTPKTRNATPGKKQIVKRHPIYECQPQERSISHVEDDTDRPNQTHCAFDQSPAGGLCNNHRLNKHDGGGLCNNHGLNEQDRWRKQYENLSFMKRRQQDQSFPQNPDLKNQKTAQLEHRIHRRRKHLAEHGSSRNGLHQDQSRQRINNIFAPPKLEMLTSSTNRCPRKYHNDAAAAEKVLPAIPSKTSIENEEGGDRIICLTPPKIGKRDYVRESREKMEQKTKSTKIVGRIALESHLTNSGLIKLRSKSRNLQSKVIKCLADLESVEGSKKGLPESPLGSVPTCRRRLEKREVPKFIIPTRRQHITYRPHRAE